MSVNASNAGRLSRRRFQSLFLSRVEQAIMWLICAAIDLAASRDARITWPWCSALKRSGRARRYGLWTARGLWLILGTRSPSAF